MKRITKIAENTSLGKKKIRVAAYCRVSTASEEQLVSLAAQKAHYENYIKSNDEWEFAGLYYDEGISGMVLCQEKVQIKHAFFKVGLPCQSFCFFV